MNKPFILDYDAYIELNEKKKTQTYEYGCAMLEFNFPDLKKIHASIEKDDLYLGTEKDPCKGLEKESHVTLLYGLHTDEVEDADVKAICTDLEYDTLVLDKMSAFENPKFDVLKLTVSGPTIRQCNKKLSKLPHTSSYPDYKPHMTIAYLKSGKAKKYIEQFEEKEYEVTPTGIIYSKPENKKAHWKIKLVKHD